METRHVVTSAGVRLAYLAHGTPGAPPLVALHALGERGASWDPVAGRLAAQYRVYAPDLRGHGDSDWPGAYSLRLMRDDVIGFLDELGLPAVTLAGHSMGGAVAYLVAIARPDRVRHLVIEDAPLPYRREPPAVTRPDGPLPFDWGVVPAIQAEVSVRDDAAWAGLAAIAAPTLLIGGGPASHIPQDKLAEVAAAIGDCTLVTIPAGHRVHDRAPEEFAGAVLGWLGAQPAVS